MTLFVVIVNACLDLTLGLSCKMNQKCNFDQLKLTKQLADGIRNIIIGLLHAILGILISRILKKHYNHFHNKNFCKLFTATFLLMFTTWFVGAIKLALYLYPKFTEYLLKNRITFILVFYPTYIDISAIV